MSGFFEDLIEKRQKFISGLDANKGDINLDIFEDFYPDQAHFLYELLQNSEDAEATEAQITLDKTECTFEHNGKKLFSDDDVLSITGIHNSTKAKASDKIGKFGVGFKSVFVYTKTPSVYSGQFSFEIVGYVLPKLLDPKPDQDKKTIFHIPFNNPSKSQDESFREIKNGLDSIAETTLLFLPGISQIKWKVGSSSWSSVYRKQHSDNHYEVVKEVGGHIISCLHFLRFDSRVNELDKHVVSIAFPLDFLPKTEQFNPKTELSKQMKVIPASPGTVAVFFPAEKETSNLRFHIHAPFVPELSRASIKETAANEPLFRQLADLAASSLKKIRDYGLLSTEFLGVLPNDQDQIPQRYECIRQSIIHKMNTNPLTPTQARKYAPANQLVHGKASLKELLTDSDLAILLDDEKDIVFWSASSSQKNSNSDRFLSTLDIDSFDIDDFINIILCNTSFYNPKNEFYLWLNRKGVDWIQKLYSFLFKEMGIYLYKIKSSNIVAVADGRYLPANKCFFPDDSGSKDDILPRVIADTYSSGKNKTQKENAKYFLNAIGVRQVDESHLIEEILRARYTRGNIKPEKNDLIRFVSFLEKDPSKSKLFRDYFILEVEGGSWSLPGNIYLDKPFIDSGIDQWLMGLTDSGYYKLSNNYQSCGIKTPRLLKFLLAIGVLDFIRIDEITCYKNPEWNYLGSVHGVNFTSTGINRDFYISGLDENFKKITHINSKLIWSVMANQKAVTRHLKAYYQKNQSSGARSADSLLVHRLRSADWVPQGDGLFVKPSEASRELLPDGFQFDSGWPWIKAIKFGEDAIRKSEKHKEFKEYAKQLGINSEKEIEWASKLSKYPADEVEQFFSKMERQASLELPEQQSNDPDRRSKNVAELAVEAPERKSELKTRSVSTGVDAIKEAASKYLQQQYTNEEVMICQICQDTLPFKLADGAYYFEKVEFLTDQKNRHYQNYLALCPNHSAMFKHANNSKKTLLEDFMGISGNQMAILLADTESSLYFTKNHIVDIKAVIYATKDKVDDTDDADLIDGETPENIDAKEVNSVAGKNFNVGDSIKIADGPFINQTATIEEVYSGNSRLRASLIVFGRPTSVEFSFSDVGLT